MLTLPNLLTLSRIVTVPLLAGPVVVARDGASATPSALRFMP